MPGFFLLLLVHRVEYELLNCPTQPKIRARMGHSTRRLSRLSDETCAVPSSLWFCTEILCFQRFTALSLYGDPFFSITCKCKKKGMAETMPFHLLRLDYKRAVKYCLHTFEDHTRRFAIRTCQKSLSANAFNLVTNAIFRPVCKKCGNLEFPGLLNVLRQEGQYVLCDFRRVFFEGEMPRINKVDLRIGHVVPECLCARGKKDRVVPAPNREHWRLGLAQCLMPPRILFHVVLVIVKESQLDKIISGPIKRHLVEGVAVGTDMLRIPESFSVLELRGFMSKQTPDLCFGLGILVLPVGDNELGPERTQPFLIGIPILRNDRLDAIGMFEKEAEANWSAVILDVDAVLCDADRVQKLVHNLCYVIECVGKLIGRRLVTVPIAGHVSGNDVVFIRQFRNKISKHVG